MSDFSETLADVESCTGADCYARPSDRRILYLKNKVSFQLGLQPPTYDFTRKVRHMVDPIRIDAARWRTDETLAPYNVMHVRSQTPRETLRDFGKVPSRARRFRTTLKHIESVDNRYPWIVMTYNGQCKHIALVHIMQTMGMNVTCQRNDASVHPYIDCFAQQVRAVNAQVFIGDPISTISQNIIRWRRDSRCSPSWCSGLLSSV